jgi:hypothetical protein
VSHREREVKKCQRYVGILHHRQPSKSENVFAFGNTTAELRNGMFDEGSIALQHGAGTIKFRKVLIKPL